MCFQSQQILYSWCVLIMHYYGSFSCIYTAATICFCVLLSWHDLTSHQVYYSGATTAHISKPTIRLEQYLKLKIPNLITFYVAVFKDAEVKKNRIKALDSGIDSNNVRSPLPYIYSNRKSWLPIFTMQWCCWSRWLFPANRKHPDDSLFCLFSEFICPFSSSLSTFISWYAPQYWYILCLLKRPPK